MRVSSVVSSYYSYSVVTSVVFSVSSTVSYSACASPPSLRTLRRCVRPRHSCGYLHVEPVEPARQRLQVTRQRPHVDPVLRRRTQPNLTINSEHSEQTPCLLVERSEQIHELDVVMTGS